MCLKTRFRLDENAAVRKLVGMHIRIKMVLGNCQETPALSAKRTATDYNLIVNPWLFFSHLRTVAFPSKRKRVSKHIYYSDMHSHKLSAGVF